MSSRDASHNPEMMDGIQIIPDPHVPGFLPVGDDDVSELADSLAHLHDIVMRNVHHRVLCGCPWCEMMVAMNHLYRHAIRLT